MSNIRGMEIAAVVRMNPQIDQFMHEMTWKLVSVIILGSIGAFLLRELLQWIDRWSIRVVRSRRAKRDAAPSAVSARVNASAGAPHCPSGHGLMIKRTARRGESIGSNFWGCPKYPRCRETRAI